VEQLEVWFAEGGSDQEVRGQESGSGVAERPATAVAGGLTPGSGIGPVEVAGRLLRARVLLGQQQASLSNLTIEDGVQCVETQTFQPGEPPVLIRGDRLEAANVSAPNATVTITGRPARFEGRGLGLTGSTSTSTAARNACRSTVPDKWTCRLRPISRASRWPCPPC